MNAPIDATICRSGDIFVKNIQPEQAGRYYWVDLERLSSRTVLAGKWTLSAHAKEIQHVNEEAHPSEINFSQSAFVMCQRFIDQRRILRVVNVGNACFDEIVDTFTGIIQSRNSSFCRNQC